MEKIGALERETIICVLTEGRQLANELKRNLQPTTDSREACHYILVENIISSYENAIKLLDCMALLPNGDDHPSHVPAASEGSDLNSKDHQLHKCKKRKTSPKWSERVRVRSEVGFEGALDDGYNWRKYGQKDILGAIYPRAYYRCTHRKTKGCLSTKQVQRADDDPSIFEVIYRGRHTCMHEIIKHNKENPIFVSPKKEEEEKEKDETTLHSHETTVTTIEPSINGENQELVPKEDHCPSMRLDPAPVVVGFSNSETQLFPDDNNFFGTNYSSHEFLSPTTSDSYFSLSPCPVSDFAEIISNPTILPNFSFGELDVSIDQIDFDSHIFDCFE
ncbi:WRKY transcription factor [Orobanche gracilis]